MGQKRHSLGLGAFLAGVLDVSLVMSPAVISLNRLSIRGGWKLAPVVAEGVAGKPGFLLLLFYDYVTD